jgi:membrane associated rhomboid family serine protease
MLSLLIAMIWLVFVIQQIVPIVKGFGIRPRDQFGLIGIIGSPFLHGNLEHILANTLAILSLGFLFCLSYARHFVSLTFGLIFLSGFVTWIIGPSNSLIIGASGYTYALMGFMVFMGFLGKQFKHIFFSIAVVFLHGGAIYGLFPNQQGVSWQTHVAGFFAGLIVAKVYSKRVTA